MFLSSEIISSICIKEVWSESRVLSEKKGFRVCQKVLLLALFFGSCLTKVFILFSQKHHTILSLFSTISLVFFWRIFQAFVLQSTSYDNSFSYFFDLTFYNDF